MLEATALYWRQSDFAPRALTLTWPKQRRPAAAPHAHHAARFRCDNPIPPDRPHLPSSIGLS